MKPIFPKLTEREKEVLNLIIQGYSNKEICEKLIIAPTTLKCHIATLYQKHFISRKNYTNAEMRLKLALNYLNKIFIDIKSQNKGLIEQNRELQEELQPFKDDYFKGLDNKTIAELAKKSIRITTKNSRLENCLQEIKEKLLTVIDCGKLLGDADEVMSDCFTLIKQAEEE